MDGIELPVTRYAPSGDVSIAYQVTGDGAVDRCSPGRINTGLSPSTVRSEGAPA
jgi:hypothetical protein